jgi:ElaB/YqjD/DUF883 family membrane-anchored ribosome-binding protein
MSFGVILQVAIGLVFVYLLLALFVSAFQELLEAFLRRRADYLLSAIKELIGGSGTGGSSAFSYLMTHPLITPDATAPNAQLNESEVKPGKTTPSYIPSKNFALVLIEYLRNGNAAATIGDIKAAINQLPDGPKQILSTLLQDAGDDLDKFKARIETWFDDAMDRLSGFYKRHTQKIAGACGLLAAILFNVNSIEVARTLWLDPSIRSAMTAAAEDYVKSNSPDKDKDAQANSSDKGKTPQPGATSPGAGPVQGNKEAETPQAVTPPPTPPPNASSNAGAGTTNVNAGGNPPKKADAGSGDSDLKRAEERIKGVKDQIDQLPLPLGWQTFGPRVNSPFGWFLYLLELPIGWLITALAISLGAPFWFDTLKLLINIRAAGPKPGRSPATDATEQAPDRRRT